MCISIHQHSFNSFCNWLLLNNHNQTREQPQTGGCRSPETLQTHPNHCQIHSNISKGYTRSTSEQVSACKRRRTPFPAPRGYREGQEVYLHFTGFSLISRTGSLVPATKTSSWIENTKSKKSGMFESYCIAPHYSELMSKI